MRVVLLHAARSASGTHQNTQARWLGLARKFPRKQTHLPFAAMRLRSAKYTSLQGGGATARSASRLRDGRLFGFVDGLFRFVDGLFDFDRAVSDQRAQ